MRAKCNLLISAAASVAVDCGGMEQSSNLAAAYNKDMDHVNMINERITMNCVTS